MIPNMPVLGIQFDIDKIDSGAYGLECWKIIWRSVDIQKLGGTLLFEGDTAATLRGSENVFCIAIQPSSATPLQEIRAALERSAEFHKVAASPKFVEGDSVVGEPLPDAGRVDAAGNLVGDGAFWSRAALDAVRKE